MTCRADARFARDVAESTEYVPSSILAAPMMSAEGEVVGVTSVLDPSVDEASDWTLHVLGTLASHMAMLLPVALAPRRGDSGPPRSTGWAVTCSASSRRGRRPDRGPPGAR